LGEGTLGAWIQTEREHSGEGHRETKKIGPRTESS